MKQTPLNKLKQKCVAKAIEIKLKITPYCEGCGAPAITAHHLVRQANSNYLRCSQSNLFSTCKNCHCLAHSRGDMVAFGRAILSRGKKWHEKLIKDSAIRIHDNISYWKKMYEELCL